MRKESTILRPKVNEQQTKTTSMNTCSKTKLTYYTCLLMKRTNTKKLMTEDVSDELLVGRFKRWPTCKLEKKTRVPRLML